MDPRDTFRLEAEELLQELEAVLLELDAQLAAWPGNGPVRDALVARSFRALHTLKGSGSMFGPDRLVRVAHVFETVLDQLRIRALEPTTAMLSLFLEGIDILRRTLDGDAAADDRQTAAEAAFIARLETLRARPDAAPAETPAAPIEGDAAEDEPPVRRFAIRLELPPECLRHGIRPEGLLDELRELGPAAIVADPASVPPLEAFVADALHLVWYAVVEAADQAALDDVFVFVADAPGLRVVAVPELAPGTLAAWLETALGGPALLMHALARAAGDRVATLPARATTDGAAPPSAKPAPAAASVETRRGDPALATLRVPAQRLDMLMDQVGELVIAQARLAQLAHGRRDLALSAVSEDIERLAAELRDSTMSMRMLEIGSLFGRFRRVVRDLSSELDKAVELVTEGEETELDKTVLERLSDPLIHLIRNSIDHGLEPPAERRRAGKPATGTVRLTAQQMAGEVVITITDDGRGLDVEAIRRRAVERGLLAAEAEPAEAELLPLIFEPGFSTAAQVTNLSGRGVGMDVVKRTIDELRGQITLHNAPGKGARFELRLPLTLAIIDGLLVRIGQNRFVVPLSAVEECVELDAASDRGSKGRSLLTIRETLVPFLRLHEAFGLERDSASEQKVVVVRAGTSRVGLVVDQVVGQHQTVVKSLSVLHRDIVGLGGATILGDGEVALIIDVAPLVATAEGRAAKPQELSA